MSNKKSSELICSVKDIFTTLRGEKYYEIPSYQRGYKWTRDNVNRLLDDINHFEQKEDSFYCLQHITIVNNTDKKDRLNVIDGQQRLTTLYILFTTVRRKSPFS